MPRAAENHRMPERGGTVDGGKQDTGPTNLSHNLITSTINEHLMLVSRRTPSHRNHGYNLFLPLLAVFALMSQGCALSYTDPSGDRHVIGLVDVSVHSPGAPQTFAGDVVETTSLGVSVGSTPQGGFVTVGYSRNVTAMLRDNALVLGNPVTALEIPPQLTQRADQ